MTGDSIIIGAVGQVFDREVVRTYGFTDRPYHDEALAGQLEHGTFLPIIDPGADLDWSEEMWFAPQGGASGVSISSLPLIALERDFHAWLGWVVAGFEWTIKRGRPDQPWADWELVFAAEGESSPEFVGNQRMILPLRGRFSGVRLPAATEVFDESTPNESIRNRIAPLVYGDVFQAPAIVVDPAFFTVFAARNLAVVRRVSEGGLVTPNWIPIDQGYQITQSSQEVVSFPITADIGGPPREAGVLEDLLEPAGLFLTWTGGLPDGIEVFQDPPDSEITENTVDGGADIVSGTPADGTGGGLNASRIRTVNRTDAVGWVLRDAGGAIIHNASENDQWPPFIASDDGEHLSASLGGSTVESFILMFEDFGAPVDPGATITGVTVRIRARKDDDSGELLAGGLVFREVSLVLPTGAVSANRATEDVVTNTKADFSFGSASDSFGVNLSPSSVNHEGFGVRVQVAGSGNGMYPVRAELHELEVTLHAGEPGKTLRLYFDVSMVAGDRMRLRAITGAADDSISLRVGGVDAAGDPIPDLRRAGSTEQSDDPNADDPGVRTFGRLVDAGEEEFEFIAQGPWLGVEFYADGVSGDSGAQHLLQLALEDLGISRNRLVELTRGLIEESGKDPDADIDLDSVQSLQDKSGNPALGWYVRSEISREQLLVKFAQSCGGMAMGGLDGKWFAALLEAPRQPDHDYLVVTGERSLGPAMIEADRAEALTDRVAAALNVRPLRDSETAGALDEATRQRVMAEARIIARVNWGDLGNRWPVVVEPEPAVTLSAINPNTGAEAGGTAVTATGTGFSAFDPGEGDTWTIGGNPVTGITVVSDIEMTGETPAGTGTADVVVTIGEDSATLVGGFAYTGAGAWTPAEIQTRFWAKADNADAFADLSGNNNPFTARKSQNLPSIKVEELNGKDVWAFNGTNQLMGTDAGVVIEDCHLFYVWKGATVAQHRAPSTNTRLYISTNNTTFGASGATIGSPTLGNDDWRVTESIATGSDKKHRTRAGAEEGTATDANTRSHPVLFCGGGEDHSLVMHAVDVAEVISVDPNTPAADIERIQGYLHWEYGLQGQLDASHPYKDSPP